MGGRAGRARRVTAADVALAAGVSTTTVSLVVNGKDTRRVLPETRQRVLAEARRLGYQVDRRARSLATGRSGIVGFAATGLSNSFFGSVQMGLLEEFGDRVQMLSVATEVGHTGARANMTTLLSVGVDGVIVEADALDVVGDRPPVPIVLLDSPGGPQEFVRVNFDLTTGADSLAAHLLELGHRRIGYLQAGRNGSTFAVRFKAFADRIRAAGGTVVEATSAINIEGASERMLKVWPEWDALGVTAIVCACDVLAYGTLDILRSLGVGVPDRVALASFDDLPTAALMNPALTCVHLPALELGRQAARVFLDVLAGNTAAREVVLPSTLVVRASTGPVAGR
ncbi:LacI family DNA-binding transcriptional regulator [Actinomadura fulvescens]|uniref:LacI family DNA-binding transcriptional regulator n=1 Tax=Actinomadura fulvescens TaxID=46160 RepID=A0ABN3PKG9_9ACTN